MSLPTPDVIAVCGERQFRDATQDVLLNPILIMEVLSKSTANYDRSEKFLKCQAISSFREYLLIAQDQWRVERFRQTGHRQWTFDIHTEP